MSYVPIQFRNWWDGFWDTPYHISKPQDQHLINPLTSSASAQSVLQQQKRPMYVRPWRNHSLASRYDSGSTVSAENDAFQIKLDVQQFSPDEISVKVANNDIIVEGKHPEKEDEHGHVSRNFVRRYIVPGGYDTYKIVASLSSDGILTIIAPRSPLPEPEEPRTIQIVQSGQPMKKLTQNVENQENENSKETAE